MGFGAQGRHLKGDRTAWEGNGSLFTGPHPTALAIQFGSAMFSSVGKGWFLFSSFPFQFRSVLPISFSPQFSSAQFASLRLTSLPFTSLRFASVPFSFQFSSVRFSQVQFSSFVTSRAVAVHFSVGEGSVLFVSFSPQLSSVRSASFHFKVPKVKLELKLELKLKLTL